MYNLKLENKEKIKDSTKNCIVLAILITILCYTSAFKFNYNYKIGDYASIKKIIEYTNKNKQNVYLYTVPSLQFRYLAYSAYEMPPKDAFSNLRVIGGWDMFTKNYYDFKDRYSLNGTLTDLVKDNVYLIDGEVWWSGKLYDNYKQNIINSLKEHYNIKVYCEEIEQIDNLKIYKLHQIN